MWPSYPHQTLHNEANDVPRDVRRLHLLHASRLHDHCTKDPNSAETLLTDFQVPILSEPGGASGAMADRSPRR